MKKAIPLILALVLCLSLCACGAPKTIADACKKADNLVEKWDQEGKSLCGYTSEYVPEGKMYSVTVYSLTAEDETEFFKEFNAKDRCEFVYEELEQYFSSFDVAILAMMIDENQNVYYATLDNKMIDLEGLK